MVTALPLAPPPLAPPPLVRGDIVGTVVDEGAGMVGYAYGVVVKAGPKQAEVRWQYGTGRYHQTAWRSFMRKLDGESAAEAREVLGLIPPAAGQRIDAARAVAALAGKSPVEVLVAGAEEAGRAAAEIEGASRVACEDGKREG